MMEWESQHLSQPHCMSPKTECRVVRGRRSVQIVFHVSFGLRKVNFRRPDYGCCLRLYPIAEQIGKTIKRSVLCCAFGPDLASTSRIRKPWAQLAGSLSEESRLIPSWGSRNVVTGYSAFEKNSDEKWGRLIRAHDNSGHLKDMAAGSSVGRRSG